MLILTRQEGEGLKIGEDITVTVTKVRDEQVQVGITAPPEVVVLRQEVSSDNNAGGIKTKNSKPTK